LAHLDSSIRASPIRAKKQWLGTPAPNCTTGRQLWYRELVSGDRPGSSPPLPPLLDGFSRDDERRAAAAAEYGKQFQSVELDQFDDSMPPPEPRSSEDDDADQTRPNYSAQDEVSAPPDTVRPNLEPVSDNAHPPQNRRLPTQPPSSLVLELGDDEPTKVQRRPEPPPTPTPAPPEAATSKTRAPTLPPRHSPAPVRRGLFSRDRVTNVLAGVAVGLLLMIFPAKKLARSHEVSEVEPLLTELDGAIEHPLGVDAGLVESPDKIAAKIHAGRDDVRRRYLMIWLLLGVPIGIGLGLAPHPGE
jgi:hypothetical protein